MSSRLVQIYGLAGTLVEHSTCADVARIVRVILAVLTEEEYSTRLAVELWKHTGDDMHIEPYTWGILEPAAHRTMLRRARHDLYQEMLRAGLAGSHGITGIDRDLILARLLPKPVSALHASFSLNAMRAVRDKARHPLVIARLLENTHAVVHHIGWDMCSWW